MGHSFFNFWRQANLYRLYLIQSQQDYNNQHSDTTKNVFNNVFKFWNNRKKHKHFEHEAEFKYIKYTIVQFWPKQNCFES